MGTENYVKVDVDRDNCTIRVYDVNGERSELCFDYHIGERTRNYSRACCAAQRMANELGCDWGSN